jgi:hypothetical protein
LRTGAKKLVWKRKEFTGGWRKLHNEALNLYSSPEEEDSMLKKPTLLHGLLYGQLCLSYNSKKEKLKLPMSNSVEARRFFKLRVFHIF